MKYGSLAFALIGACSLTKSFAQTSAPILAKDDQVPVHSVEVIGSRDTESFNNQTLSLNRLPADLKDLPQSAIVIDRTLMDSQGATSLASALRNVPGLTIAGAEGGQIGTNINLNGFSARTDMYLDGVRDRGQYYRDTFSLSAIEVLMGPSSMLFGRGSTGGVINQVSKTPTLKANDEIQVSAMSTGLIRTTIDHNQGLTETSAFRIAAMAQGGNPTGRDQNNVQDYGVAPSFKFGIGEPTTVTLSALFQYNNDQVDYGIPNLNGSFPRVSRNNAYGYSSDRTISDVMSLSAVIEHKLSADTKIRNQTVFDRVLTNAQETSPQIIGTIGKSGAFNALPTGTSANPFAISSNLPMSDLWVRQQSRDRVIQDNSFYNVTEINGTYRLGSTKHETLIGMELGNETYSNQGYFRNGSCNGIALNATGATTGYVGCTSLENPSGGRSPSNVVSVAGNLGTGSANIVGLYLNDTIEINPAFKVVAGVRQDYYSASINNSISSSSTPANADQTVNYTSVRGGLIWQPYDSQSYYLSYSTSFNPSLEQLTNTTGLTSPLAPQENRAYEVGGKWDLNNGGLSLTAAAFQITQYNARSQDALGIYTATGTVQVNGARLGIAGRVTERLQLFGGYAHLNAKIINAIAPGTEGNVPANTPTDSASLWGVYSMTPEWEVGAGATYASERYANNTNLTSVGSYVRWDAMLAYHQPRYDVRLNLYNLTNAYYYDSVVTSDGGRAVPGLGRSAMLTLSYRF